MEAKGIESPGAVVTGICKQPDACAGKNSTCS